MSRQYVADVDAPYHMDMMSHESFLNRIRRKQPNTVMTFCLVKKYARLKIVKCSRRARLSSELIHLTRFLKINPGPKSYKKRG